MAASSLDTIFGAALVGIILSAVLYGIFNSQFYTYFGKYPKDTIWSKSVVVALWIVLSFQLSTNIHMIYVYLIKDFGQLNKLKYATWDWLLYVLCTSISAAGVQCFFARRVFLLTRQPIVKYLLTGVILSLSIVELVVGIYIMAQCYKIKIFLDFRQVTWGVDVWLGCGSACDILIALSMCYFLHTSRTGIRRTDRMINKLMAYAIQTGAATSITEIICLATFTGGGFHFGHILLVFPLSGLYSTSLMANLHARRPTNGSANMSIVELNSDGQTLPGGGMRVEQTIKFAASAPTTNTYLTDNPGSMKSFTKPFDSASELEMHTHSVDTVEGRAV
ncbi:hypothetical protein B0H21DRAFT_87468 [Amylocystis lapponica]|nr:hypothetical protein B0H21DRAFT_87468 [Amylocystis lapponica]